MESRTYHPERDRDAARRIWQECGWIDREDRRAVEGMDHFLASGHALVAMLDGDAECVVATAPLTVRYLSEDLAAGAVTSVCTSRIARRRGIALRLTARAVADNAAEGALISALGIFDQGYYDKLGYGIGPYEHLVRFDPARLRVREAPRTPCRLTLDDSEAIHRSRLNRLRAHGACNLMPPQVTRADILWCKKGFGLGYRDGPDGELTHHLWCNAEDEEVGPYEVKWMSYRNGAEFLELMALLKSLGDQVHLVKMREPPGIQLQDLIEQPLRQQAMADRSRLAPRNRAIAYWQMRICDLERTISSTRLPAGEVRFNLKLSDPIGTYLDGGEWRGVAGDYVVTLGSSSGAERGTAEGLPVLRASVGAWTRLWLGARPASGLSVTDRLAGSHELLARLDEVLRLPDPHPEWEF